MDKSLTNKDLAPTPNTEKSWSMWHIAALWVGMAACIPTYTLASGMIDQGWSWQAAVLSVALGNFIALIPMILNAHAGAKYGIPFPVLLRSSFGVFGANIPAMMRAFVACGWFGIQTWIGGSAIYYVLSKMFACKITLFSMPSFMEISSGEFLCFLSFWLIQILIILKGMNFIKILETVAAPLLIFLGLALFFWAWKSVGSFSLMIDNYSKETRSMKSALLGAGVTGGVAFWGTLALSIPDFARFARSQKDQIIGQAVGLVPAMTAFAFIGAVVTNSTIVIFNERIADPVALISRHSGFSVLIIAMVGVIVATLTTNIAANIVSPANDFSNLMPQRISFKKGAVIAATIGIMIMPWKLYNNATQYIFTWLMGYGAMLGSVAGVMISDYYVLKKRKLSINDLYKVKGLYTYSRGFNVIALFSVIVGIAPNVPGFLNALGIIKANNFFSTIYERAWFVSFIISFLLHLILSKSFKQDKMYENCFQDIK